MIEIGKKYGLESVLHQSLHVHIPKEDWKKLTITPIKDIWHHNLRQKALLRPSMQFMEILSHEPGHPNPVWPMCAPPQCILAAGYWAKMLVGSYILQATRARFYQHQVDPTCQLCGSGEEDLIWSTFLLYAPP